MGKIGSEIRNKAFWMFDHINGGDIKKAYSEIRKIDTLDSDDERVINYQNRAIKNITEYAAKKTKQYSVYLGCEIADFPIITKNDIKTRQNDFISTDFKKEKLIQMSTSGSTGTPFVCYQDKKKKKRVNAEVIYYSERIGYQVGNNLSYIRSIVKQNKKTILKQIIQNQTMIDCGHLDDSGISAIENSIKKISEKGPIILLAYGSTYTSMARYYEGHKNAFSDCNVIGAISGSDMLLDGTRETIKRMFDTIPFVSRYSNEENGVIGQDEEMNNVFPINEADYFVEIVDFDGNVCKPGEIGRIVITDLYNFAQPLIRYDTGDIGAIRTISTNGRNKKCITDFSGRRVDIITDTQGRIISPYVITNHMWSYTDIIQFQLIQRADSVYTIKLNVSNEFLFEEVIADLKSILGEDAIIDVEIVDEIPVLSSGKRRYIVNEMP